MGKTIEIPIELADCIRCDKELPTYIDKMKEKFGSVRKVCEHIEQVTDGGLKANTVRQAYKRRNGVGIFVPKKPVKEWPKCRECGEEYIRNSYTYITDQEIDTPADDLLCEKCLQKQGEERREREAHKRDRGIGTNVPKKSEGSTSEDPEASTKSRGVDTDRTVVPLAPQEACCGLRLAEWHTVREGGWYSGLASNKVRDRCRELQSQFVSLHVQMIKFFRNDVNARKEKLSREDWGRLHEETKHFAVWLMGTAIGMGKVAGIIEITEDDKRKSDGN